MNIEEINSEEEEEVLRCIDEKIGKYRLRG